MISETGKTTNPVTTYGHRSILAMKVNTKAVDIEYTYNHAAYNVCRNVDCEKGFP